MGQHNTLRSSLAGVAMGVVFAGISWESGAQPGMTAAVGIVWTVAGGTLLYVHRTDAAVRSKWALVTGGAVFIASLAALSTNSISATAESSLHLIVIGLSLLSYHAGMAAVHEQRNDSAVAATTTPVRD